ncbi:MAG: hypothetical protein WBD74_00460 [Candidatus Aquilonibacter sp.]
MKPFSRLRLSTALISTALMLIVYATAAADTPLTGTWSVQLGNDPVNVQFGARYDSDRDHSDWTRDVPISSLAGLTRDQLQSNGVDVRFDLVREAGTLHCAGYASHGGGGGTFTFAPSTSFSDALASRGISRPDAGQQLRMAMANVTIAFVDMLRHNSNAITTTDEIIRVLNHGVDERYITGLAAIGYKNLGADDLVRLRDHGVSVDYAQGMLALGYHATPEDLIRLRDHGVTLDFVKRVRDRGYNATLEQLIRLRDAGIN